MADKDWFKSSDPIAWCRGCGNFGILNAWKEAFAGLGLRPEQILMVSGIGQAAKLPHYLLCNTFNGLHGRALPAASGAGIVNPGLVVIAEGGDGDGYAEGGNHFIHAMRRNVDMTYAVHDNQIYGLTKGQASPTSEESMVTGSTPRGNPLKPERPLALAVASDCSFVARGFAGEKDQLVDLMKKAVTNKGFSLLEILQPCVSFNKVNTFDWYRERVYDLAGEDHDPADRAAAFEKALEWGERIPTGVIYTSERETHAEYTGLDGREPLCGRPPREASSIEKLYPVFR
ncbi:MAG TPA: 2-oxoacid:ferredoxin oxidoreductase subunit beta [Candidatus Eisenbacteria bacterium]|uniref:2-oxoacid:ferredoxin oxidoreductase subunit beta n=1 Tax=Eiseniibacteriota bacterium TaxID=2212470 RepID=A0A7V2AW74_UNCEI|nr:2-oxoacid:ferredoxin oxidoreductase subunit beta [Candidatus Eisenbacteria bacterium]